MEQYSKLRSSRIIVKLILGIIILSLIFGTMNSYINQDFEKYAATVNGEKINFQTLQQMYLIEREKQKKMLGKKFLKIKYNKEFIQETYNYVLSQLVNNVLLEQYTKKINFQINDNKAKNIILNAPIFQEDKKFNQKKYFKYLASINLTNHEYINKIKTQINTEELINAISDTDFVLKNENNNILKLLSQKRKIKKLILNIDSVLDKQKVTDLELFNYFSKNKDNFYSPEKFKISFIQLKPNRLNIKCSDKEIHEWYIKNINKYSTKEQRKYSIIQTKTKDEASLILSQLNQSENFSKIAKEKSIDPISSKKGGDIGWIPIDMIPKEIKKANLSHKNQISNVIPFQNEFLIIKLNDILVSRKKTISEVFDTIKEEIKNKKSILLYHTSQKNLIKIVKDHPNRFDLILKKINISPIETDWFDKTSVPEVLNIPILKKIIFKDKLLNKNEKLKSHSGVIILKNNQSFILSIKDYQNKKQKTFESIKNKIITILKRKKSIENIKKQSNIILCQLRKGDQTLLKKLKLKFNTSQILSRYDKNSITSIIFALPYPKKDKKIYTLYQDKNKNFVIVLLEEIYHEKFSEKENKIIIKYLQKNNTETVFNSLLKSLRAASNITYEKIDLV